MKSRAIHNLQNRSFMHDGFSISRTRKMHEIPSPGKFYRLHRDNGKTVKGRSIVSQIGARGELFRLTRGMRFNRRPAFLARRRHGFQRVSRFLGRVTPISCQIARQRIGRDLRSLRSTLARRSDKTAEHEYSVRSNANKSLSSEERRYPTGRIRGRGYRLGSRRWNEGISEAHVEGGRGGREEGRGTGRGRRASSGRGCTHNLPRRWTDPA